MFSIYKNTYDIESGGELALQTVYELITLKRRLSSVADLGKGTDLWPYHVQDFRRYGTQRIKLNLLPAVIFYATTTEYDRKVIKQPSGLFCVDLDYADNKPLFDKLGIANVKKMVTDNFPSTALAFISPSGRGLKVVHRIMPQGKGIGDHAYVSSQVFEHYLVIYKQMGLAIDTKCLDWGRLCYLSFDRGAFYNPVAVPDVITIPELVVQPPPVINENENGYQLSSDRLHKDQVCPLCKGGQHRDKSFTYYVDQYGTRLDGCGVCSRSKCNANIKPWEEYPNVKWKYLGKTRS